jgi:predicted N-formylglutamate amidohydrolase
VARPWHVALLSNRDRRLADRLLDLFERGAVSCRRQRAVFRQRAFDYTIPVHGERHGLSHALVEIRQDLIAQDSGQQHGPRPRVFCRALMRNWPRRVDWLGAQLFAAMF